MSNQYGPRIVTDGLVLCLDAANRTSYPGSGTVWNDLSGNNNNGTLVNGPSYSNNSIIFDGIDDHITINPSNSLNTTSEVTITSIVRVTAFSANRARLIDTNPLVSPDNVGANISLKIGTTSPFQDVSFFIISGSTGYEVKRTNSIITSTSIPYIISARWRGSDGASSIFINGIESPSYALSTTFIGSCGPLTNTLMIGRLARFNIYGNQVIYATHLYNRYLSNNEILQNYNALKGRYSL
jgi:hypothetical protein